MEIQIRINRIKGGNFKDACMVEVRAEVFFKTLKEAQDFANNHKFVGDFIAKVRVEE
jgi:hypothetical protein